MTIKQFLTPMLNWIKEANPMNTVNVIIQNPAMPSERHTLAFVGMNNAMSAVLTLDLVFADAGLMYRHRPTVYIESEIGPIARKTNREWTHCTKLPDGRVVVNGDIIPVRSLTTEPPVAMRNPGLAETLPSWVWTWAAGVGL